MTDNFIAADDRTLFKVSLTQKVVGVITSLAFLQIALFPTEFSVFGSPNVLKNNIFKLDDYLGRKVTVGEKLLFNFILYLPFIILHSIMSKMWFKSAMQRHWRNYVFYERLLFNLVASISSLFMLAFYQPDDRVLFSINFPYAKVVWYALYVLGLLLSAWALADMGENDLYCFGLLKDFRAKKGSKFPAFVSLKTESILRASCRHPLGFATYLYNAFGPTVYTATRLGHIITLFTYIYIGTQFEEKSLKAVPGYVDYMKATPNKFIPDVRVWVRGVKARKKD